jgi:hypothetical protein
MIVEDSEIEDGIKILFLQKYQSVSIGSQLVRQQIPIIINQDCDGYDFDTQKLLFRFRKNVLSQEKIDKFYDAIYQFAKGRSNFRTKSSGGAQKASMSNIFGFFEKFSPQHIVKFKKAGYYPKIHVRECAFNLNNPDKYKQTLPLIKQIDRLFSKLVPNAYKKQKKEANCTFFRIDSTSFTTITTNINYQTSVHVDAGDYEAGFGNLVVIEKSGSYSGGETCFPEYGIGIDLRTKDILFMDVHEKHANLPIILHDPKAIRLSIVCYLRTKIPEYSQEFSNSKCEKHLQELQELLQTKQK